jgi:hypothetical protein
MALLQWAWVDRGAQPGPTTWPGAYGLFGTRPKTGELFSPSTPVAYRQNPADRQPMVGGGVTGEQASRVVDRIGHNREWGLTRRLVYGGGDRRRGKDVSMREQGSPAGSEQWGRKYSVARCLGWGRGSHRGARAGYPRQLSDGKHGGAVAVKRAEEEEQRGAPRWGAPFIAARGGGTKAVQR